MTRHGDRAGDNPIAVMLTDRFVVRWLYLPMIVVLLLVVALAMSGVLDQTPYEAYGIPDPPSSCERGEAPQRLYLTDGRYALTCRVP